MRNNFFDYTDEPGFILNRLKEIELGKIGFYSIGLYPASLAYNCAMQTNGETLLLAPRPGRELLGAFPEETISGMDQKHVDSMMKMGSHYQGKSLVSNNLADLILRCELVMLSSNSNHVENDLKYALHLRQELNRKNVVLCVLSGSFSHDSVQNKSYILCQKIPNLAFFSGFHRHGSLRNPLDSFTANFCHPDALTAMLGAVMLDRLSPNIQVSAGVHNLEGQYIKAAKNMSSIFAGFGHTYHRENPGVLPTLLTLLLDQCLDQAASVSMFREDRRKFYEDQPFELTELGYGVQRIEATLQKGNDLEKVRDHTFAQLTAMVADVRGSMMIPLTGKPTRNFQAGQILAENMKNLQRCPNNIDEFIQWCESSGIQRGGLEGIKSLQYWPEIMRQYSIPLHDSSMVNLLYMSIYSEASTKKLIYKVMTQSRELTNYCQESVRPKHSRKYAKAINNLSLPKSKEMIVQLINSIADDSKLNISIPLNKYEHQDNSLPIYIKAMNIIEDYFRSS